MDGTPSSIDSQSTTKQEEKIDFDKEYRERFANLRSEAEAKGFRYLPPDRSGVGWKIHLAVSDSPEDPLTSRIAEFLKGRRIDFKIGWGGTTEEGKGMTIYIGDRDTMEDYADELNKQFGQEIPEQRGQALETDMPIAGNIWARFENTKDPKVNRLIVKDDLMGDITTTKYLQYGPKGVPALVSDGINSRFLKEAITYNGVQMRERAVIALTEDYGAFFTGTRNHTV